MGSARKNPDREQRNLRPKHRIGIQLKAALVVAVMVLAATASGGWLYYAATQQVLRHKDYQQADRLASGLALAASEALAQRNLGALKKLTNAMLRHPSVHSATILSREGKVLAKTSRLATEFHRVQPIIQPPSLSYEMQLGRNFLEVGRPVVISTTRSGDDVLVGGVRLVLDTRPTAEALAGLRRQVAVVALSIVLLAIPIGQLLVWRVLGVPIRKLVRATRQLAEGDFSARVDARRNDELGELAASFDVMVERLCAFQQQLRQANESLEHKVAARTAELERANRRLREEMAEKEDFLRAVSHDLNAPLRNIAGMATMIVIKYRDQLPEEIIARLQRIQANVEAGTELLGELLELSRIKTRPQKRQMVDFQELLEDLKGAFEYELKQKNITLTVHSPMPRLYVEHSRMRQLFQNLIDNAIKYMGDREDGRIDIGYHRTDGMHSFSVADNGPGVAPEDQQRIFHVFRRGTGEAHGQVQGKGVGLALVRTIAQNYDGWAWVESKPGEGATFFVALAVEKTQPPQESAHHAEHHRPKRTVVTESAIDRG